MNIPCLDESHSGSVTKDRPHTTRFLSCDGSDRTRYETTGNRRGSWHLSEIGTLAIHNLTLHDFRRTTDQIGCDMSRPVIAGNRGK